MSFPLRIAVAFIFALHWLAAAAEFCIWCDKKTQNDFLACFSEKIRMNRELNIEPFLLEAMVKSLPAASNVINTPDKVKNTMMNGALSGEVVALITSISSPGRNRDIIVANIIRPLEECYATISGKSGTKFAASIGKTVMDTILDVDSDSDNNEYSLGPERSFISNKDYPKQPPIIENSPFPSNSPNQAFSAVQPPGNFESAQQTPLRPLQPLTGSTAPHSFQQNREFTPNIRKNIENGEPIQGENFFQPASYVSVPQNGDNYASFLKQDFPASGSYASAGVNEPQNRDNNAPFQNQKFSAPGSFASNNANMPQNGDNRAQYQNQDFPASGSYASAGINAPRNGNNFAPFQNQKFSAPGSFASNNANMPQNGDNRAQNQNQDFPSSGSYASAGINAPQNGNNYPPFQNQNFPLSHTYASTDLNPTQIGNNHPPFQRNLPASDSYGPAGSDIRKNGDNYASFQKQDFVAPNSFAAANSKVGQNEENYTPNNNGPPFLGRNNQLISKSSLMPPKPVELTPNIPQLNQSPLMPSPAVRSDSKDLNYNDGINSKNQPINPLIFSPADRNVNRSPAESNVASSSSSPAEKNNYVFENYPNNAEANAYNGGNVGQNGYYNDYENNRWIPNGQPSYGLIPDYDYNPINSPDSGINSDGNQPQMTQSSPDTFPLQGNLSPNFQPLNGQTEYLNSDDRFAVPTSVTVSNLEDRDSGVRLAKSNEGKFSLQKAPKQENNNQPEGPSSFVAPQSDGKDFGTWKLNGADKETPALLQDGFNGESQSNSNRQMDIPANSTQNGSNSKETSTQTTTVATTQLPTIRATTKTPATAKPDVLQNKTCALEFAEANFIHLSESDIFRCVFNEDTPHDQAVSVAANVVQNAFREADLANYAYKSKRICIREVSRLSPGATSQDYAEKISKCTTIVVYKNGLLKENCKAAGKFMAEQILNVISYITDALDTDNNEQNNKPQENNNPFQIDYVPNTDSSNSEAPDTTSSDSKNSKNYNAPQSNNANTLISVTTVSEEEIPKNYNGPQPDNIQNKPPTDSSTTSQVPKDGAPINNHPLRKLPRSWNNKKSRGSHPSTSDNNGPGDANSSNNADTPVSPQNSYIRNSNYYNAPQPNNAPDTISSAIATVPQGSNTGNPGNYDNVPQSSNSPSSASAAAYEGSEGEIPDEYNGPQSDSAAAVSPTDSLAASQVPNDGVPISNYPLRELLRRWNNKKSRGEHPSISNNAPDDATSGNDAKTPVSQQNSYVRNPNYYKAPQAFNAPDAVPSDTAIVPQGSNSGSSNNYDNVLQTNDGPSSASAAAFQDSEGRSDIYNGPDIGSEPDLGSSDVSKQEAPVSNHPLREHLKPWHNKKNQGKHPSISDNNAPNDATSGNDAETPISPQNSYVRNPNYYNAPQSENAPDTISSAIAAVPQDLNTGIPNKYDNIPQSNNAPSSESGVTSETSDGGVSDNDSQSDSPPDETSADSLTESQVPKQGAPVSNPPLRGLSRLWKNKKQRGRYPNTSDSNTQNDANNGNNVDTSVSPQNSYVRNPNYYNTPDGVPSATAPQGANSGSPNNYDNNGPNIPTSDEQPFIERNVNKYNNLNSKKNPLLNKLTDSNSRNHIDYLMKTALNCVSPSGFNYKAFTLGMASVATAMRKQHPNESPEVIINKTYLAAIVALIEDFQNAVFNRQESEGTQPLQNSQPLSRPNSESAEYRPSTNQQNSGASTVSQPLSRPNYESIEYRPSTNQQNSGASIVSQPPSRPNYEYAEYRPSINQQNSGASVVSVVNSNSAPISYQNAGNYQDTFQAVSLKENPQQTYANPSLQSVGQNSWAITNRNTLLNASPRERPQSFDYNQAGGFAYDAAG